VNIILFMSDSFRYDNLSCYTSKPRARTRRLDAFAKQAYVFDNAYLGSFPTIPNRLDIISGRFSFIDHEWCPLPPETVTLQQVLSASGITTQLIVDNPHMLEMGFDYGRGFEGYEWIRGQESDHWRTSPKEIRTPPGGREKNRGLDSILKYYVRNTAWWQKEEDHFAPRSVLAACRWLEENQDQSQFFLHLDLFDPHEPWDAPKKYLDLYDPDYKGEDILYPHYGYWRDFFTEREMQHIHAQYLAEVSMVDHWFGVLLDKLDELGLSEDTAVIFATDHGYMFGEHELTGKSLHPVAPDGSLLYEAIPVYNEMRRTPLMIRMPGHAQGKCIDALVQAPDLMPTILEMAGLAATEVHAGQSQLKALQCGVFYASDWAFDPANIHGKSLMPLIRGETTQLRDIVVCSNTIINHTPLIARSAVVTSDGWCLHYAGSYDEIDRDAKMWVIKLIKPEEARVPAAPKLFYLRDDPTESKNVIESNWNLAEEIHTRYVDWLEGTGTPPEHLAGRRRLR
jgi:arylsulfatase A-like enzyme